MSIELESLGTLTVIIARQFLLPGTGRGGRLIGEAGELTWKSERVNATQLGASSGDWVRLHPDGTVTVDARLVLRTDDGATIAMTYTGKADRPPAEGGVVWTAPTFETDDERYAWLNTVQAVGRGQRNGNVLVYELYALR
ncbi:DUF3237 domain-containing protein [Actinophytocola oryzae]|uniref:DUF3237 domain-containing protein n=1 Tax=Actinophytocola oryzae TaxID=502181 RepID=UPI001414D621|nr:DUF3237 domain-containing protein [Actinophytocola oryzae]